MSVKLQKEGKTSVKSACTKLNVSKIFRTILDLGAKVLNKCLLEHIPPSRDIVQSAFPIKGVPSKLYKMLKPKLEIQSILCPSVWCNNCCSKKKRHRSGSDFLWQRWTWKLNWSISKSLFITSSFLLDTTSLIQDRILSFSFFWR